MLTVSQKHREPDITVLELRGRLDAGKECVGFQDLVRKLRAQNVRKLVLDAANLEHADSAGLGALVFCATTMQSAGAAVRLAQPGPALRKLLQATGIEVLLPVDADAEQSCRNLLSQSSASSGAGV